MNNLEETLLHQILFSEASCFIFGSYVYKYKIRGDPFLDIDCVCENVELMKKELEDTHDIKWILPSRHEYEKYKIKVESNGQTGTVDLLSRKSFDDKLRASGHNFINSLILTKNGIEHLDRKEQQKNFIEENLKQKKFCPWSDMKEKHKEYFGEWKEISPDECQKQGLRMHNFFHNFLRFVFSE